MQQKRIHRKRTSQLHDEAQKQLIINAFTTTLEQTYIQYSLLCYDYCSRTHLCRMRRNKAYTCTRIMHG